MYNIKKVVRRLSRNGQSIIDLAVLLFSTPMGIFGPNCDNLIYDTRGTRLISEKFNGLFYHSVLLMEFRCLQDNTKPHIYKVFLRTRQSIRHDKNKMNLIISEKGNTAVLMTDRDQGHKKIKYGKYRFIDVLSCVAIFLKHSK